MDIPVLQFMRAKLCHTGLYASFLKGRGHKPGGMEAIAFVASMNYQVWGRYHKELEYIKILRLVLKSTLGQIHTL